jgi:hypothetical protein
MLETAGANPTIGTLSAVAAALKVGLKIEFVPFSEMLAWENGFSQDEFKVETLDNDRAFLNPQPIAAQVAMPFYRPRRPQPAVWRNTLTVSIGNCVSEHFSTMPGNIWMVNYERPRDSGGATGFRNIGPTAIPVINSQPTMEGLI